MHHGFPWHTPVEAVEKTGNVFEVESRESLFLFVLTVPALNDGVGQVPNPCKATAVNSAKQQVARCYARYTAQDNGKEENIDLIRLMLPLWMAVYRVSTKHGVCLSQLLLDEDFGLLWKPLHRKVGTWLNKCQEKKEYPLLKLCTETMFGCISNHCEALRHHQSIIKVLQHLIFLRTEHRGGCSAGSANSPNSSSETNPWKQKRRCSSASPWDTVGLTFLFHNTESS